MMDDFPAMLPLAGTTFLVAGYLSLSVAVVMGILALRSADTPFEKSNRRWVRLGFLLLAGGLIIRATNATAPWGDGGPWERMDSWSLVIWLAYAAVLHMHYTTAYKGRKAIWASLFAWGLAALTYPWIGRPGA